MVELLTIVIVIAGGIGGLIRTLNHHGRLVWPLINIKRWSFRLGFPASIIIGAVVSYFADLGTVVVAPFIVPNNVYTAVLFGLFVGFMSLHIFNKVLGLKIEDPDVLEIQGILIPSSEKNENLIFQSSQYEISFCKSKLRSAAQNAREETFNPHNMRLASARVLNSSNLREFVRIFQSSQYEISFCKVEHEGKHYLVSSVSFNPHNMRLASARHRLMRAKAEEVLFQSSQYEISFCKSGTGGGFSAQVRAFNPHNMRLASARHGQKRKATVSQKSSFNPHNMRLASARWFGGSGGIVSR